MRDSRFGTPARQTALVGVLTGLSLLFLYLSSVAPMGQLGVVAVSGLFPAGAIISASMKAGIFCYTATGLLGLLLVPDKGNVFLYLLFLGLWPVVKSLCERLRSRMLEWMCKLGVFDAVLTLAWFGIREILLPFLPDGLEQTWMIYAVGNVAFLIYDVGFSKLIAFYAVRVDKVLRKTS